MRQTAWPRFLDSALTCVLTKTSVLYHR